MIKVNYTAKKKLLLNFQNSQMKKRGETLFGECTCLATPCRTTESVGALPIDYVFEWDLLQLSALEVLKKRKEKQADKQSVKT